MTDGSGGGGKKGKKWDYRPNQERKEKISSFFYLFFLLQFWEIFFRLYGEDLVLFLFVLLWERDRRDSLTLVVPFLPGKQRGRTGQRKEASSGEEKAGRYENQLRGGGTGVGGWGDCSPNSERRRSILWGKVTEEYLGLFSRLPGVCTVLLCT